MSQWNYNQSQLELLAQNLELQTQETRTEFGELETQMARSLGRLRGGRGSVGSHTTISSRSSTTRYMPVVVEDEEAEEAAPVSSSGFLQTVSGLSLLGSSSSSALPRNNS